ncbi:hypothetical protein HRAG_02372, partial [Helicobacter bilis ATCC 43879]
LSSVYGEIREIESKESKTPQQENCPHNNANTICLPTRTYNFDTNTIADQEATESLKHIQIHLKAYYNQDSIPNKEEQKQYYQEQKKQTKWGYMLFDKEIDIDSKLKEMTKDSTIPLTELKEFHRIYKEDSIAFYTNQANTPNNTESKDYLLGGEIELYFKEQWQDKQIRFFAYMEGAKSDVGVDFILTKLRINILLLLSKTILCKCIVYEDFVYTKEINNNEYIAVCQKPLSEILTSANILQLKGLDVEAYYDDWYMYCVLADDKYSYNLSFGLLKMRENEYTINNIVRKDSNEPAVAISFIPFDMDNFIISLKSNNNDSLYKIINYPISVEKRKQYDAVLRKYFDDAKSVGGYFIAELYIKKILSINNFKNYIAVSPSVKRNKRICDFLDKQNKIRPKTYDYDKNLIYIGNSHKPTLQDKNVILATHTGNVNFYSFVAEIKFHANALLNNKDYFDKWHNSAIIADMGVAEGYGFSLYQDYYDLDSKLVKEQVEIHSARLEQ